MAHLIAVHPYSVIPRISSWSPPNLRPSCLLHAQLLFSLCSVDGNFSISLNPISLFPFPYLTYINQQKLVKDHHCMQNESKFMKTPPQSDLCTLVQNHLRKQFAMPTSKCLKTPLMLPYFLNPGTFKIVTLLEVFFPLIGFLANSLPSLKP